jgi:hypothetical protein
MLPAARQQVNALVEADAMRARDEPYGMASQGKDPHNTSKLTCRYPNCCDVVILMATEESGI